MPDLSTSAFAAISFSNGFAGAIGYFAFGYLDRLEMSGLVFGSSLLAIICYLIATQVDRAYRSLIVDRLGKYQV
jgi:hypothetical protein